MSLVAKRMAHIFKCMHHKRNVNLNEVSNSRCYIIRKIRLKWGCSKLQSLKSKIRYLLSLKWWTFTKEIEPLMLRTENADDSSQPHHVSGGTVLSVNPFLDVEKNILFSQQHQRKCWDKKDKNTEIPSIGKQKMIISLLVDFWEKDSLS